MAEQGGPVFPVGLLGALQRRAPHVHWLWLCPAGDEGEQAIIWAAWYITRLLVKLTPKGVVFAFLSKPFRSPCCFMYVPAFVACSGACWAKGVEWLPDISRVWSWSSQQLMPGKDATQQELQAGYLATKPCSSCCVASFPGIDCCDGRYWFNVVGWGIFPFSSLGMLNS